MTLRTCPNLAEIKQSLANGHWPHAAPAELRLHAATCKPCSDQILIAQAFQSARASSTAAAQLPPPGILWWRAQLRRQNAAVERIGKPLLSAHIFALAITLLLAAGFAASQARQGLQWLVNLRQSSASHLANSWQAKPNESQPFDSFKQSLHAAAALHWNLPYLLPALAILALVSTLVLCFALDYEDREQSRVANNS